MLGAGEVADLVLLVGSPSSTGAPGLGEGVGDMPTSGT